MNYTDGRTAVDALYRQWRSLQLALTALADARPEICKRAVDQIMAELSGNKVTERMLTTWLNEREAQPAPQQKEER